MAIALAIVAGLGILSLGLNFVLSKYLFRILSTIQGPAARIKSGIAYDGKYYPCTLIVQVLCNQDEDRMITDFSLYESQGIVGMTYQSTKSFEEEFGEGIREEDIGPVPIRNVVVYQPVEGMWSWKF